MKESLLNVKKALRGLVVRKSQGRVKVGMTHVTMFEGDVRRLREVIKLAFR